MRDSLVVFLIIIWSFSIRSCTHTYGGYNGAGSANPWWRVDLFNEYAVNKVIISNREDCCSERLNGFQVEINVIVSSCS